MLLSQNQTSDKKRGKKGKCGKNFTYISNYRVEKV